MFVRETLKARRVHHRALKWTGLPHSVQTGDVPTG
jgi:hypothetical protein